MGVTAILNAAQGTMSGWNYVNTKESYYTKCGIKFLGVPALDVKHYPINEHFVEAANYIDDVIKNKGTYTVVYADMRLTIAICYCKINEN